MPGPSKRVERHLDEAQLAAAIDEAQKDGNPHLVRRLCYIRNLYAGDSISEAAARVGVTQPTGSRWVDAWNTDGVAGLEPDFGGGRPPKLSEKDREAFRVTLERHQPLTPAQIQQLLAAGFDVSYSRRHISRLIRKLDIQHTVEKENWSSHPDSSDGFSDKNLQAALADLEE